MKKEVKKNKKDKEKIKVKKKHPIICIILSIFILLCLIILYLEYSTYKYIDDSKKSIYSINNNISLNEETIEYGSILTYNEIIDKLINKDDLYKGSIITLYIDDLKLNNDQSKLFNLVETTNIKLVIETNKINIENKYKKYEKIYNFFKKMFNNLDESTKVIKTINWQIIDTKYPVISGVKDKEITVGYKIDLKEGITASDEIDGSLEITIEGTVDTSKAGEYKIIAKAIDKNLNETKEEFKVTVKSKPVTKKPSSSSSSSNKSSSSSSTKKPSTTTASSSTKSGRLTLAKQEAKKVVQKIIKPGMTKYQKAEAICDYITTTVSVQSDQSNEAYKTNYGNEAYAALIMKKAACSGRCKAVMLLCEAAGLKCKHINANQWTHQWNEIQIDDGSWVVVDSQIGFIGDKHPFE